jgi:hypothetical protein
MGLDDEKYVQKYFVRQETLIAGNDVVTIGTL